MCYYCFVDVVVVTVVFASAPYQLYITRLRGKLVRDLTPKPPFLYRNLT